MKRIIVLLTSCLLVTACGEGSPDASSAAQVSEPAMTDAAESAYTIDAGRITVSGLSSGAYMATQLHVAYPELFSGAGLIAGGPYDCAAGSIATALGVCIKGGDIDVDGSVARAMAQGDVGLLAGQRVWVFRGTNDAVMHADTSAATVEFYRRLDADVTFVDSVAAPHGMPTLAAGNACDAFAPPWLNACDYDAAGEMLSSLYEGANAPTAAGGEILSIDLPGAKDANLLEEAALYVPEHCANGEPCGLHLALHGCLMSSEVIEDAFVARAGFNRWADALNLVVLYPQVKSSSVAPMNPNGCWDWWGYTGGDYAGRDGAQMQVLADAVRSLAGL